MRVVSVTVAGLVWAVAAHAAAQPPINPVPRASLSKVVKTWAFDTGDERWKAENQCSVSMDGGRLLIQSTGNDPFLHCGVNIPGGDVELRMRIRSQVGGSGSVYWTTDKFPRRSEDQRADFEMPGDGKWLETAARFHAPGQLVDLRIDPGTQPGVVEIDWIELVQLELHPLTVSSVDHDDQLVRFEVTNHQDTPVSFSVGEKVYTVAGAEKTFVEQPIDGARPLEVVSITLECDGWLPLVRSVWHDNPAVQADWIERPMDGFELRVARDGSVAQIRQQNHLVAFLGPMVLCDGKPLDLKLVNEGPVLRFRGADAELTLSAVGKEIAIAIEGQRPCEGPVVRAKGSLEQGLFAGLEYLGKGERSSSKLDIETNEHIRFAPDPLKVTMPLMAFVTDRGSVAMTWKDMTLQPVYATPNFFDGSADHRMTLRGRKISATIRFDTKPLEESIMWAVEKNGLPELPQPPRTTAEQQAICLAALSGPLKTKDGWGHCVQKRWGRRPFSDMASTVWRLGGEVPQFPRLADGGAHVPNGTIYFVTGRAQQWLDIQRNRAQQLIRQNGPDGSYRYAGKYRRGHFEDTASGVCALPAVRLLEFAYVTGDKQALAAGLRTLEFMKRFRTPRGAQVWECPLHIPDQLASAYLVWAYVRGYQLTGDPDHLRHARKWALSGIPFTYLWHVYPTMSYATPPVFGATNWTAPNWMGLPVQWVGGVYAYALALLAPHEDTLDWNHIARGVLTSAQQQQYPDGPHVGLLPDSFNIRHQRRQPADINPCALVSLQFVLDGRVDFLSVAADDHHRVAAPFPVTIQDGAAHIQAKRGVAYQVLVDGQRIVDVKSNGNDVVDLDG